MISLSHLMTTHGLWKYPQDCLAYIFTRRAPHNRWLYFSHMTLRYREWEDITDLREMYDHDVYNFSRLGKMKSIVDVGAHIGTSVVYFANRFPEARIIAFEPNVDIFKILDENVAHNLETHERIILLNKALVGKPRHGKSILYIDPGSTTSACMDPSFVLPTTSSIKKMRVETTPLQDLIKTEGIIDLLKIDAEGAEYDLYPEIVKYSSRIKSFIIEVHTRAAMKKAGMVAELMGALSRKYKIFPMASPVGYTKPPSISEVKYQDATFMLYGVRI